MNCAKCGTELHSEALLCWRCGNETPAYTAEVRSMLQNEEDELLEDKWRNEWRAENPAEAAFEDAVIRGSLHPVLRRILVIVFWLLVLPVLYVFWNHNANGLPESNDKMDLAVSGGPIWLIMILSVSITYIIVRFIDGDLRFGDPD